MYPSRLLYLTGNSAKFEIARRVFCDTGIELVQSTLKTPEIQSRDVQEVARFSAICARQELNEPFLLTDAGLYIEALNGFPGPYMKHINGWLTGEDILLLMRGKPSRRAVFRDCLAYCQPEAEPRLFLATYPGSLAKSLADGPGSTVDRLFIPDGYPSPLCTLSPEEQLQYWVQVGVWRQLKAYIAK